MKLIIQPGDGVAPIVRAIQKARKSIDIVIFRFDRLEVEKALDVAVDRGVVVRALIAHTNKGGEKNLRKLELRLLECGATVARTADDLTRYHGKLMIIDRDELHLYGFNFTGIDLKSRSLGIVARDRRIVNEALRLFESDVLRQEFEPGSIDGFVVSPENAREQLAMFIKRTRKSLVIWDPKLTDPQMIRLLQQRAKAGVDIRVIGKMAKRGSGLRVQKSPLRLHVRAAVRDCTEAFVGSQSLRALELDGRREVGILSKDPKVVKGIADLFEVDWARTELGQKEHKVGEKELALAAS